LQVRPFASVCAVGISLSVFGCSSAGGNPDDSSPAAGAPAAEGGKGDSSIAAAGSAAGGGGSGHTGSSVANGGAGSSAVATSSGGAGAASSSGAAGKAAASGGGAGSAAVGGSGGSAGAVSDLPHFSFFVTSYAAMQRLSGKSAGFGGDLRFTKPDGLSGADEICRQIADMSLPGAGSKPWRAFLSVTKGADGKPVNAIDRVGSGPWYDRLGRLIAQNITDLGQTRPQGADPAIIDDLPNEDGVPNHAPDGMTQVDNHDILTGSSATGTLFGSDWSVTCHDWTSSIGADGKPRVGHSWPRQQHGSTGDDGRSQPGGSGDNNMNNWTSALTEAGCGAGANLVEMGGPNPDDPTVGSGGGYGGIYCFALTP
jgi:hypothetical protein